MRKIIFLLVLSLLLIVPAFAQEDVLVYGTNMLGTLSAESSQAEFTFGGTAGDLVTIEVIGVTAGLDPAVSLNSPALQNLASNDNDPLQAGTTDARISLRLPENGVFRILVNSVTGTSGDFLLRLNGQTPPPATELTDAPQDASITPDIPQFFSFGASSTEIITLNVTTATADFGFRTIVRDANGSLVALVSGSDAVGISLPFAPGDGLYTAEITALDANAPGQVSISVGGPVVSAQAESTEPVAEKTEEALEPCGITPNGGQVNVRSGPSTAFDIIAELQPSQVLEATGTANYWYQVVVPNVGTGWVSDTVVFATGECRSIPEVEPPLPPPTATLEGTPAPVQATPTATATPAATEQPATTPTVTATPAS